MRGLIVIALIVLLVAAGVATWDGRLLDECGRPTWSVLFILLALGLLSGAKAQTKPGCLEWAAMFWIGVAFVVLGRHTGIIEAIFSCSR